MNLLKEKRNELKLSQKELACASKIPLSTISKWETGAAKPNRQGLEKLSKFFKIPIELFAEDFGVMDRIEDMPKPKRPRPLCVPPSQDIETPVSEITQKTSEKTVTREEFIRAAKRSMDKLRELVGESKSSLIAAELLRTDIERRLW